MPFAAALSTLADSAQALDAVCSQARQALDGTADLALVFFSPHHAQAVEKIGQTVGERLGARCLLGCGGESIVGNDQEVEEAPALVLWAARFPGEVKRDPFHLVFEATPDGYSLMGWPDELMEVDPQESVVLLLGDPYTFPADAFLNEINNARPGLRVMGGMSSGHRGPGAQQLLLDDRVLDQGAVGVLLSGAVKVRSIVSQGCRPIGRHFVITKAQENIILELGGKPPLVQLQELWPELAPAEQQLVQRGLHVGRVINEYQDTFQRGDFLVRNVLGIDRQTGALAIGDRVRVGQTIQFHVRDADSADEDLKTLLQMDKAAQSGAPAGALLFTCNGRGSRLFAEPHHDARAIRDETGQLPVAGFFAQGELGPVGGQNFIHGFTASVVLFED
ncbi:MAG: FIST N-terminal domain-containing protein [Gemmataceae bacterium]